MEFPRLSDPVVRSGADFAFLILCLEFAECTSCACDNKEHGIKRTKTFCLSKGILSQQKIIRTYGVYILPTW